ncbi:hypothetical protein ATANTOWER_029242 [Ataeniobius toweri]|uniref:Uncharacterized protein n=1 Tax=Ataeniobius toweri TaxID=208326 RepID=A0ABU7CJU9_9TELE|nr:hypothetical protein [Ataeniobius toweri]
MRRGWTDAAVPLSSHQDNLAGCFLPIDDVWSRTEGRRCHLQHIHRFSQCTPPRPGLFFPPSTSEMHLLSLLVAHGLQHLYYFYSPCLLEHQAEDFLLLTAEESLRDLHAETTLKANRVQLLCFHFLTEIERLEDRKQEHLRSKPRDIRTSFYSHTR